MTLKYDFSYDTDNGCSVDFDGWEYEPDDLTDCISEYRCGLTDEENAELSDDDIIDDDGFYDFAYGWFRDEAYDAFMDDDDVAEAVADACDYAKDPCGYFGAERWY